MTEAFVFGLAVTIRVSVLLLVALCVGAILRKRSAAVKHALWASAIVASLAVPGLSLTMSRIGVTSPLAFTDLESAWTWLADARPENRERYRTLTESARSETGRGSQTTTIGAILGGRPSQPRAAETVERTIVFLWLAGLLFLVSKLVASSVAVILLRRQSRVIDDPRVASIFDEVSDGDHRGVMLLECDGVAAPATGGVRRSTIFLPVEARDWNTTRLRATLAHEYAHAIRRDCLIQLFADLARAIYWFNPLIWYTRRRMIVERERACDDLVLGTGVRPEKYASVLVDTVRGSLAQTGTIALGTLSMARPSELETRLVSILDPKCHRERASVFATTMIATLLAAGAILIATASLEASPALALIEPDLRGDSIASPLSEKLRLSNQAWALARNPAALHGPDSILARKLFAQLDHSPGWEGDLVRDRSAWALSRQRDGSVVTPLLEALADRD